MGVVSYTSAQFDAKKCSNNIDCPTTLCCGTATPQIARYGEVHKICYRPTEKLYMNYNGYKFDFACDPIVIDGKTDNSGGASNADGNASKKKYEARFWDRFQPHDGQNIPGYGVDNPWIPPIRNPESLITIYDRWTLTSRFGYNPLIVAFWSMVIHLASGDSWDGYWYNNWAAAGDQVYPTGLAKYYDLYSWGGLFDYAFSWLWVYLQQMFLPYTLMIPIDVWVAIIGGMELKGVWKIMLFYPPFASSAVASWVAEYFKVEMEDGWGMLNN